MPCRRAVPSILAARDRQAQDSTSTATVGQQQIIRSNIGTEVIRSNTNQACLSPLPILSPRRQRAKNRQQKLLAGIAQSQKKFISDQNAEEHSLVGSTPSSFQSDLFLMDQSTLATTASNIPIAGESFTDYECCVCRTTKSVSESPIGLIGTSCFTLRKNQRDDWSDTDAFILL